MMYIYKCFDKVIKIEIFTSRLELFDFWLKRFCPNVIEMSNLENKQIREDLKIIIYKSEKYNYVQKGKNILLYGKSIKNSSFIAKFVTQCFQSLLISDGILIIPAACVKYEDSALCIIGDFWQGKTATAINISNYDELNLVTDNYIAINSKNKIVGFTKYISIREEDSQNIAASVLKINNRYFYENDTKINSSLKIKHFLLPYINSSDNNIHLISDEESKWYLYQKFTRLLSGETILFDGKMPSPIFLNKNNSIKILNIVNDLLINCKITYVSASMDVIVECGKKILKEGKINE